MGQLAHWRSKYCSGFEFGIDVYYAKGTSTSEVFFLFLLFFFLLVFLVVASGDGYV